MNGKRSKKLLSQWYELKLNEVLIIAKLRWFGHDKNSWWFIPQKMTEIIDCSIVHIKF